MAVLWLVDATRLLGAHPWWSGKVVYFGAPIGVILAAFGGPWLRLRWRLSVFAGATLLAFWVAYSGKAGFTASYAEDHFAGRMWFFGWIATMAGLAAFTYTLAQAIFAKHFGKSA